MRKKCPTKADVYNRDTSMYYAALVKAYGKEQAEKHWRRRTEGILYEYEIFTSQDLIKIKAWSAKFTYKGKWTPLYYNDTDQYRESNY